MLLGALLGVSVGLLLVAPRLRRANFDKLTADELHVMLSEYGMHYDFTVASTEALEKLLGLEQVQERFMDSLLEIVGTGPITHTQYELLRKAAHAAAGIGSD
jgi:hypothetical protein